MVTQKGLLQIAAAGSFLCPFFERPARGKTNLFETSAKPKTAAALQRHGNKSGIFLQFGSYLTEEPLEGASMFQPTTHSRQKSLKTFKLFCEDFRTNFSQYPAFFIRKIIFEAQFQLIYLAFPPQPPFKVKVPGDFQTNHKIIPFSL